MATVRPKALVLGGSGFVGRAICRRLVQKNFKVISVSRRGRPTDFLSSSTLHGGQRWCRHVDWVKGDAHKPETYSSLLNECSAVVHSVGIINESPAYKQLFDRGATPQDDEQLRNFEAINRDTAILLAAAADAAPNVDTFVYVSAATLPSPVAATKVIDDRYLSSKREAEATILSRARAQAASTGTGEGYRAVVLRPGFMVSEDRLHTTLIGSALVRRRMDWL